MVICVCYNNYWKINEGEEINVVDDDDFFFVFWREFVCNVFVYIVLFELDEYYE